MDMDMHDRLASGRPNVDSDVEAAGDEFACQATLHPEEQLHYGCHFSTGQVEKVRNVSPANDKRMALGNRKGIRDGYCQVIPLEHSLRVRVTEWAFKAR
jgi:hypothetical protein